MLGSPEDSYEAKASYAQGFEIVDIAFMNRCQAGYWKSLKMACSSKESGFASSFFFHKNQM